MSKINIDDYEDYVPKAKKSINIDDYEDYNPEDEGMASRAYNWSKRAIEGLDEQPILDNLDYVPILGPAFTHGRSAIEDGDYEMNLARHRKEQADYEKKYPESATVKSIVGSLPTMIVPEIAGAKALQGMSLIPRALSRVGLAAAENAALVGTDAAMRGGAVDDVLDAAGRAGLQGGAIKGVLSGLKNAPRATAKVVSGIKGETIDRYKANRARINELTPEGVHNELGRDIETIKNKGQLDSDYLKSRIENEKSILRDDVMEKGRNIQKKYDDLSANNKAAAERIDMDTAQRIHDDLSNLSKEKLKESSSKSFDILQKAGVEFDLLPLQKELGKKIKAMKEAGVAPPDSSKWNYLVKQYLHIKNIRENGPISAVEMKKIIQRLDSESDTYGMLDFAQKTKGEAAKEVRRIFNDTLGTKIPKYAEQMDLETAPMAQSRSNLRDNITAENPSGIYQQIQNIKEMRNTDKYKAIKEFEQRFGVNYTDALEASNRLRSQDFSETMNKEIRANRKALDYDPATSAPNLKERKRIEEFLSPVKGRSANQALTYIEQAANQTKKARQVNLDRDLPEIAKRVGRKPDYYNELAKDYGVKRAFEGSFMNGSRNTNLAAMSADGIISLLQRLFGQTGGGDPTVKAMGAIAGAAADLSGKGLTKNVIDWYLDNEHKWQLQLARAAYRKGPKTVRALHAAILKTDPSYYEAVSSGFDE